MVEASDVTEGTTGVQRTVHKMPKRNSVDASTGYPEKDYQRVSNVREIRAMLGNETVLLSTLLQTKHMLFFTKQKILILTETRIIQTSTKNKSVRFVNQYGDLLGVTKSIRIGANNFIMHFGLRADEEVQCDHREDVVALLAERFQAVEGRALQVFGLGCASLEDYLTSERDLARRISRMPAPEYLLNRRGSLADGDDAGDEWADDLDDEMFDDFVVLSGPDLKKYNTSENLARENTNKNEGPSQQLVGKPGLRGERVELEDFVITKVIDKGSFGKVFLVNNVKMGKMYAMKRINKDLLLQKKQVQNIKNEKDILFQADHPFVNSMDFVFQNELRIYFFLKYLPGGNIYDNIYKVRRFQEGTVKFIGAQLVLALGYLHSMGIVHRDLKPENVLMDAEGYVSLADFGLAKFLEEKDQTFSFCGTAEYLAPEILDMRGHNKSVDWWTLGILLYEMATGRPPFLNKSHHKLGILIRTGRIVFPDPVKHQIFMSEQLKDCILRLLDRNQQTRLGTRGDVEEVKQHPFFADVDWDALYRRELNPEYKPQISDEPESPSVASPSLLVGESQSGEGSQAAAASIGHSIMEEDAKEELTPAQKELVNANKHQFEHF